MPKQKTQLDGMCRAWGKSSSPETSSKLGLYASVCQGAFSPALLRWTWANTPMSCSVSIWLGVCLSVDAAIQRKWNSTVPPSVGLLQAGSSHSRCCSSICFIQVAAHDVKEGAKKFLQILVPQRLKTAKWDSNAFCLPPFLPPSLQLFFFLSFFRSGYGGEPKLPSGPPSLSLSPSLSSLKTSLPRFFFSQR